MSAGNQDTLLTIHIKNELCGKAVELINSRNLSAWEEPKKILEIQFGDSPDLSCLIQDLQGIFQKGNQNPLNFISRLQTHNAKMHSAIQKQPLTRDQKTARSNFLENMTLNTLLTGLEPKLGMIVELAIL